MRYATYHRLELCALGQLAHKPHILVMTGAERVNISFALVSRLWHPCVPTDVYLTPLAQFVISPSYSWLRRRNLEQKVVAA